MLSRVAYRHSLAAVEFTLLPTCIECTPCPSFTLLAWVSTGGPRGLRWSTWVREWVLAQRPHAEATRLRGLPAVRDDRGDGQLESVRAEARHLDLERDAAR